MSDKQMIKDAVKEVLDEKSVTYANGAVKFANAVTDSWSGLINAMDGFFLRNFVEDQPTASAKGVVAARLSAAKRARDLMSKKVEELEKLANSLK